MDDQLEFFIELASNNVRRVQSPEGARFYGQPIGTVITADIIAAKNAENAAKGKKPPKGAIGKKKPVQNSDADNYDSTPGLNPKEPKLGKYGTKFDPQTSEMKPGSPADQPLAVKPPTISGPNSFVLGNTTFSAPAGSRLFKAKKHPTVGYVLTPDGKVHAFNESGEIDIPEYLVDILPQKLSNLKKDDANYLEEEFDASQAKSLKDQPPGTALKKNGEVAFVKTEEGEWENPEIGAVLTDDDLQGAFDSGKFELQAANVEETDLSQLSEEDLAYALDDFPEGKELSFGKKVVITKQANGKWKSSTTGNEIGSKMVATVAEGTAMLGDKVVPKENVEVEPEPKDDPLKPENADTPENNQKKLAQSSELSAADINETEPGDVVYHKTVGHLVKQSDGKWLDGEGYDYVEDIVKTSAKKGSVSSEPWNTKQVEDYKASLATTPQGKEERMSSSSEEPEEWKTGVPKDFSGTPLEGFHSPQPVSDTNSLQGANSGAGLFIDGQNQIQFWKKKTGGDFWESVTPEFKDYSLESRDFSYAVKSHNVYVVQPPGAPEVAPVEDAPEVSTPESKTTPTIYPGDTVDAELLETLPTDSTIYDADANISYAKNSNGNWVSPNGGVFTPNQMWYKLGQNEVTVDYVPGQEEDEETNEVMPDPQPEPVAEDVEDGTDPEGLADWEKALLELGPEDYSIDEPKSSPEPVSAEKFFAEGDKSLSKQEITDAISALEAHSGFQVDYGLKSLGAEHPLKDKEYLNSIKDEAKSSYPDMPPKKAFVKFLKNAIGTDKEEEPAEGLADWEKALLEEGSGDDDINAIQIGAVESKMTQTGVTGATFSKNEIKKAIEILENFNGKVFKAELNKQGSPLGKLSPNDIVGFNKDKTVTKQKFIDLLKSKLAKSDEVKKPQKSPIELKTEKAKAAGFNLDSEAANALPVGTVVQEYGSESKWTQGKNGYFNDEFPQQQPLFVGSQFKVVSEPVKVDEPKKWSVGDKIDGSVRAEADFEPGTVVQFGSSSGSQYTKTDTAWTAGGNDYSNSIMQTAFESAEGAYKVVKLPGDEPEEDNTVPVGTVKYFKDGSGKLTKKSNGNWEMEYSGTGFKSEIVDEIVTPQKGLLDEPPQSYKDASKSSDDGLVDYTYDQLSDLPIGTVLEEYYDDSKEPTGSAYKKFSEKKWENIFTDSEVSQDALVGSFWKKIDSSSPSKDTPDAAEPDKHPDALTPEEESALAKNLGLGSSPVVSFEVYDLMSQMKWISAIKELRNDNPWGLKEAKDFMESLRLKLKEKKSGEDSDSNEESLKAEYYKTGVSVPGTPIVDSSQLDDLPSGSTIKERYGAQGQFSQIWTKDDEGLWLSPSSSEPWVSTKFWSLGNKSVGQNSDKYKWTVDSVPSSDPSPTSGTPISPVSVDDLSPGDKITDEDTLEALGLGDKIGFQGLFDKYILTKIDEETFESQTGIHKPISGLIGPAANGKLTFEGKNVPLEPGVIVDSMETLNKIPEGHVISWPVANPEDGSPGQKTATKKNGQWFLENGSIASLGTIDYLLSSGKVSYMGDEQTQVKTHSLIGEEGSKKIGPQAGSNAGGLFELTMADGSTKKFYVKKAQSTDHGANEALANQLYVALGVNAPNVELADDGNIYSEIVEGTHDMPQKLQQNDEAWLDKVRRDFAIDAWLSNRDVFGLTYDNILTDKDNNPWKIDNGGALTYRAMGEKKTDFGDEVSELEIFRTGKKSVVFGENVMSKEQELDGAERLRKFSPAQIQEMVDKNGLDQALADKLKARRKYVLNYYDLDDPFDIPELAEPKFDPASVEPGYVFKDKFELNAMPVGTFVKEKSLYGNADSVTWSKTYDGNWLNKNGVEVQGHVMEDYVEDGLISYHTDAASGANDFVTPEVFASLDDFSSGSAPLGDPDLPSSLPTLSWQDFVDAPAGTQFISYSGQYKYQKVNGPGTAEVVSISSLGEVDSFDLDSYTYKNSAPDWYKELPHTDFVNNIAPAKYNSGKGAKTSLFVKPDGTGIFKGMKGVVKELDAEGVKKNFDAGMSQLVSPLFDDMYPETSDGTTSSAPASAKVIPTLGDVSTLPDGKYTDPQGNEYEVSGEEVTVLKELKKLPFSDLSVGKSPNAAFMKDAPAGTKLSFKFSNGDTPEFLTKNEEGLWKQDSSGTWAESYVSYVSTGYDYYTKKFKIASFPTKDESKSKKSSLKTKYLQGQLLDEWQKTVYPPGHSGTVTYYGGATDIASLSAFKDFMADPDVPLEDKKTAHVTFGVPLNPSLQKESLLSKTSLAELPTGQAMIDLIVSDVENYLKQANVPESFDASKLFQFDGDGNVPKPLSIASMDEPSYYNSTGQYSDYIKAVSATIGDGTIVGTIMLGATKDEKGDWINYYNLGAFTDMYDLEAQVAKKKGKPHPSGTKHPGHPNNAKTHNITWGSAVPGEVPASKVIPGTWSGLNLNASKEEIDNYLILAKMQNPTYLNLAEKRTWVKLHRQKNKKQVDALSAKAQQRKNEGLPPLTDPPVWSDDVKPANSWDILFDSTPFPQNWTDYPHSYNSAPAYYESVSPNEPELVEIYENIVNEDPYGDYQYAQALNSWFASREEAYLEELNKPIWEVTKNIAVGTHPTFLVKDQKSDKMKIFKPLTPGKEWRSENEVAAHNLGASFGFNVPKASISYVNEGLPPGTNNSGIVMDFAPNVGSLGNVDGAPVNIASLTPKQFGQLASEHVFDWLLDNDDSHEENILLSPDGDIIAIDKGRAFYHYGHWNGLDVENPHSLNVNTQDSPDINSVVYFQMIEAVKSKQISQEQLDEAYKQAIKAAKRIQKSDDNTLKTFIKAATDNRTDWSLPDYAKNWKFTSPHPNNQEELIQSVLARKNTMQEDFENFYDKLYAAAGFAKPVAPAKALGEEHLSGWEEADVITKTEEAKVWGAAPIHASAGFAEGASLLWTEKDTNDNTVISGKFQLGGITQQTVMNYFASKVSPNSAVNANSVLKDYPTAHVKQWKKTVTAVGKNVSANATTGEYDEDLWKTMKETEDKVNVDMAYAETVDFKGNGKTKFPSGIEMPTETVPMYVLALQYHKKLIGEVETAKAEKSTTDKKDFQDFNPPSWKTKGKKYVGPDGETYKELDDGNYVEVKNGQANVVPDIPDAAKSNAPGWHLENVEEKKEETPEKITLISAGMFSGVLGDDGIKTTKSDFNTSGHPGKEYRIDLPTGEKIFFRDGDQTGTVKSQTGTVRFHLNRLLDGETSLSNVQNYLEKTGINFAGADEEQVENVYWRQMFGRIIGSNTKDAPKSVVEARKKLLGMKSELGAKLGKGGGIQDQDVPEAVGLALGEGEHAFWNELAKQAFGAEKVNAFLAAGEHLPKYQHLDLADPEKATGLPYFKRIDVDMEALYKKGKMIAHGNNGKDDRHFDYIKSGAYTSTEERLRILGYYKTGASSSSDQQYGAAKYVFTRIANGSALKNGSIYGSHVMYWSPEVMAMTGTYSYPGDNFGNLANLQDSNKYNPLDSLDYSGGGNETMIPNNVSIYDFMEVMVFENESKRKKAIEEFKKKGIETLRGVPIEERLVMRTNLDKALTAVKKAWGK